MSLLALAKHWIHYRQEPTQYIILIHPPCHQYDSVYTNRALLSAFVNVHSCFSLFQCRNTSTIHTHTHTHTLSIIHIFCVPHLLPIFPSPCGHLQAYLFRSSHKSCNLPSLSLLHQPWTTYTSHTINKWLNIYIIINVHNNRNFNRLLPKTQDALLWHNLWQIWQI